MVTCLSCDTTFIRPEQLLLQGIQGQGEDQDKDGQRAYAKERNIREDRAHKISHDIVADTAQVNIFEDLQVPNMVRRPKVKTDANGKFLSNGARAKAGLNKSILKSMWGRNIVFLIYKGLKKEKLTIKIPAHGTSQGCSRCGHIHPDNRATQAIFRCQKCGFTLNADYNASLVIKERGISMLRNGEITAKDKKTVGFRKQDTKSELGPGRSEVTCVETNVRRGAGNTSTTQRSMKREAPTSTAVGS